MRQGPPRPGVPTADQGRRLGFALAAVVLTAMTRTFGKASQVTPQSQHTDGWCDLRRAAA